jgi:beta-glucosidase
MGIGLWDKAENLKLIEQAVKVARSCDVTILAIGGNEGSYREGLDRSNLDLIGEQNELVKALLETGKPVVVLLFNGQPLSINYIEENAPAIVECWYPGEATGAAVADVLFGKVNPSGKLPITFPVSVGKIPSYYNRKPSAKLKYFDDAKEYLYPFGYGLSYTTYEYSNLTLDPLSFKKGDSTNVTITVKNTGKVAGDEIIQLYIRDLVSSVTRPVKELKGFRKVHLNPGEEKRVTFYISDKHLAMYNENMDFVVEPGEFKVMVGSSSRNSDLLEKSFRVTE